MNTPAPKAVGPKTLRPRWRVLLSRTLRRLTITVCVRRAVWAWLILAGLYAAFLLIQRLTGLGWPTPQGLMLAWLTLAAAAIGALWPRRPTLRDAARTVDRQAQTNDLFLTMLLLEGSPGEFKPLVAAKAEAKAAAIRPAGAAPFHINRRLALTAVILLAVVGVVRFVPQMDPFGRVEAADAAVKEAKKLDESKKITQERLAQIERENLTDTETKEVQKALDQIKTSMNAAQPKARAANAKLLATSQKGAADQWRKISADKLKELLSQSSLAQQFGNSSAADSKKWMEELQAGSTDSLKKEMKALQRDLEELAKTKDPVKKAQLTQKLRERVDALSEFAKDQAGSKTLAAALKRVQEQMRMASKADDEGSSQDAMKAAAESMKLAQKELEQVAQSAKDLKELEKGLAVLQMAKQLNNADALDGKKCEGCQNMGDYEAMFAKMMKGKTINEEGFGDGSQREEKDSAKSKFKTEMSKSQVTKGKVLLTLKTKGMGEHVDFKEQYRAAVRGVKQGISEAILQEEIPPGCRDVMGPAA